MKTKSKIIISIASLCLVVVAAIISIVAVFALINNGINIGGSISFTAKNIYATVSAGTLSSGTLEDAENKLQQIDYNATSDGSSALSTWSNLNLTFPESGEDVTITFTVANNSISEKLLLTVGDITGTTTNATMSIKLNESEEKSIVISNKEGEFAPEVTVTITFHILDKNSSASIENFNIPLTLERADYHITLNLEYSNLSDAEWAYGIAAETDLEYVDFALYPEETLTELQYIVVGKTITFSLVDTGFTIESAPSNSGNSYLKFSILVDGDTHVLIVGYDGTVSGETSVTTTISSNTQVYITIEYVDSPIV